MRDTYISAMFGGTGGWALMMSRVWVAKAANDQGLYFMKGLVAIGKCLGCLKRLMNLNHPPRWTSRP